MFGLTCERIKSRTYATILMLKEEVNIFYKMSPRIYCTLPLLFLTFIKTFALYLSVGNCHTNAQMNIDQIRQHYTVIQPNVKSIVKMLFVYLSVLSNVLSKSKHWV